MDARELLRRYLEQRRELGESEFVLDQMTVAEAMAALGVKSGADQPPYGMRAAEHRPPPIPRENISSPPVRSEPQQPAPDAEPKTERKQRGRQARAPRHIPLRGWKDDAWRVVDPILSNAVPVENYEPGTWGPESAAAVVMGEEGWHEPKSEASPLC